jgi:phosphatidylglycerophosphate synthase
MTDPLAPPHANARSIWTRLTVDPLVMPLAERLGPVGAITPNLVTMCAGFLAVGAAACFVVGWFKLGGLLFILRYLVDCLDGQIARVQARSSARGAALDLTVDVVGISVVYACLASYLISRDLMAAGLALTLMASVVVYNWALAYRKSLAKTTDLSGDGGAGGTFTTNVPILRQWTLFCARIGMSPLPWAVEAEILALGLGPLLLPHSLVPYVLICVLAFYFFANIVNIRRIWRIAGAMDSETARVS